MLTDPSTPTHARPSIPPKSEMERWVVGEEESDLTSFAYEKLRLPSPQAPGEPGKDATTTDDVYAACRRVVLIQQHACAHALKAHKARPP